MYAQKSIVSRMVTYAHSSHSFVDKFVQELKPGDPSSREKFAKLKEAYGVLSDSASRHEYDVQLGLITKDSAASLQSLTRLIAIVI